MMEATETQRDETHNGWTNYPTWIINAWLLTDNDQLQTQTLSLVAATIENPPHTSEYWDHVQTVRYNVADALQNWITYELAPDLGASFSSDLLSYALGQVNWNELADGMIAAVAEAANDA